LSTEFSEVEITITSFKLRYAETHVRILPRTYRGLAFEGPGVDLRGAEASLLLEMGMPIVAWLKARDPSVDVRGISCSFEKKQVLISYQAGEGIAASKPIALKIHAPESEELLALTAPMLSLLKEAARSRLARRNRTIE
jgi:hypothetical protein